MQEPCNQS